MAGSGETEVARIEISTSLDHTTTRHALATLEAALSPVERDDRFDRWPADDEPSTTQAAFLGALAWWSDEPVGFVGGQLGTGDRPQLDALVATDAIGGDQAAGTLLSSMLDALRPHLVDLLGGDHGDAAARAPTDRVAEVELWAKPARPWHAEVAAARGMRELRALHQMRCPLPVAAEPLPTRAYTDDDFDALLAINNRAFATHPDQGHQTPTSFAASMAEPWFRSEGVRLHERDSRLAGFCWTKIHPTSPPLGEIYVIGVDPDFHGRGLGVPMTAAGLAWLADQGLDIGMLYVEADNVPAIRTYERLGFDIVRTDRAWLWAPLGDPAPGP